MITTLKNQKFLILLFLICSFSVNIQGQTTEVIKENFSGSMQPLVFNAEKYRQFYQNHFNSLYYGNGFSKETRLAGLSRAWAEARWNFANFDLVPQLNWDSLYFEFIPLAINAQSETEYYKVLMKFYSHLRDGHSMIFIPDHLKDSLIADLPIRCRLIENRVFVTHNFSSGEEYMMLQPGTEILEVNDQNIHDYVSVEVSPFVSFSTPQDSVARIFSSHFTRGNITVPLLFKFKTTDGQIFVRNFRRQHNENVYPHSKGFTYSKLNETTNLLTINTFYDAALIHFLDSVFSKVPHPKKLIVDLRMNAGGNSGNGFELLGYLVDQPFMAMKSACRKYHPHYRGGGSAPDEIEITTRNWEPYKKPVFEGDVVVLAGPDTYSAAEDFLIAFRHLKRGAIIGQKTGGSTGQPIAFPLPLDGMAGVCSMRVLLIDDGEFIGKGIRPDFIVNYTLEKFVNGRDDITEAAQDFLN